MVSSSADLVDESLEKITDNLSGRKQMMSEPSVEVLDRPGTSSSRHKGKSPTTRPIVHWESGNESISRMLSRANSSSDSAGSVTESFHSTSSSQTPIHQSILLCNRAPQPARDLPNAVITALLRHLKHADYLSFRLTCRSWSALATLSKPPKLPAVYSLPIEILQQIYTLLRPVDFNAARHTCRAWMLSSLDRALLNAMLRRGGWWGCAQSDLARCWEQRAQREREGSGRRSEEWWLSRRLARECSLGPDWTGNGLKRRKLKRGRGAAMEDYVACEQRDGDERFLTGLSVTSSVDFSELGMASVGDPHGPGISFTVSVCGRYLMVAEGCLVYVYGLQAGHADASSSSSSPSSEEEYGGSLVAMTCVVCPRRVIAVSMDTSSQRFAIAVLMDGRMGLVCDLYRDNTREAEAEKRGLMKYQVPGGCKLAGFAVKGSFSTTMADYAISEPSSSAGAHTRDWATTGEQYDHRARTLNGALRGSIGIDDATPGYLSEVGGALGIQSGPRSIYRHLCSDEDPPRSVAICPMRRCVAFGCAKGVELHWVDGMSGQDLNRWFPLTASSDYLFFLPPRRGLDSSRKLRLISSMGCRRWEGKGGEGGWREIDHYRAVPASDGFHVAFEDPKSGNVCLGVDAPVGGPTRLERRVMFLPPRCGEVDDGGERGGGDVRVYKVAPEMRDGVRVVICFGEKIVLYSVPGDVWEKCKRGGKIESDADDSRWREVWKRGGDQIDDRLGEVAAEEEGERGKRWLLEVRGAVVGKVKGVVDVAVHAGGGGGGGVCVWAFCADGIAWVWQIDDGKGREVRRRWVERGGKIVEERSEEEDGVGVGVGVGGFDGSPSEEHEHDLDLAEDTPMDIDLASGVTHRFEDEGYASANDYDDDGADVDMPDAPDVLPSPVFEDQEIGDDVGVGPSSRRLRGSASGSGSGSLDSMEWIVDILRDQVDVPADEGFLDVFGVGRLECDIL